MSLLSGKTSKTGSAQYGTHMEGLGGPGLPKHVLQDFPPFFFFFFLSIPATPPL